MLDIPDTKLQNQSPKLPEFQKDMISLGTGNLGVGGDIIQLCAAFGWFCDFTGNGGSRRTAFACSVLFTDLLYNGAILQITT